MPGGFGSAFAWDPAKGTAVSGTVFGKEGPEERLAKVFAGSVATDGLGTLLRMKVALKGCFGTLRPSVPLPFGTLLASVALAPGTLRSMVALGALGRCRASMAAARAFGTFLARAVTPCLGACVRKTRKALAGDPSFPNAFARADAPLNFTLIIEVVIVHCS